MLLSIKDKKFLLKDLCARLPYGVMCSIKGYEEKYWDSNFERYITNSINKPVRITGISIDKDCIELDSLGISEVYGSDDFGGLKPYLRSLSSMTEEEKLDYTSIDNRAYCCPQDFAHIPATDRIDWLNKRHFDYRGLIEKGLAIEVTKENNPYEN